MKLEVITAQNGRRTPAIATFAETGTLTLGKGAIIKYDLSIDDRVRIAKNPERPDDWYLLLGEGQGSFPLRGCTAKMHLQGSFKHGVITFKRHFDSYERSLRVGLGEMQEVEGTKAIPLITKPLRKS